ncbi:uncharacterized protein [Oryza sativa Japonica Group]|uniref:Expressed protein n=2 Tax=Oryza sativa subsp. japonica TaxID=39947 RepID=Q2R0P1_ORYSJ|nr:expressed protein [Oryza sativa Japonica Group]BAT14988.1 Os11g0638200 [Oryza sativa Japonica Group]
MACRVAGGGGGGGGGVSSAASSRWRGRRPIGAQWGRPIPRGGFPATPTPSSSDELSLATGARTDSPNGMGGSFGWLEFLLSTSHPCEDDAAEELPVEPPVAAMDAAHDGRDEVRGEVPSEPSEVLAGEEEAAMDAAHDGRGEVRGEVTFERAIGASSRAGYEGIKLGEEPSLKPAMVGAPEIKMIEIAEASSVAQWDLLAGTEDCSPEINPKIVDLQQQQQEASLLPDEVISEADASILAQYSSVTKKDDDAEFLICRPNFGFVTRPQQHTPKKRHPKNKRAMGINLLDREGNICSDDKLPSQGCLVGEYNNLLLQLYQLLFDLKELMELCGQADKIQSEVFLKKAMKKACRDSDDAVADIVFQALKVDGFILRLLRYLKSQFNFCRTQAWKIRNEILRIGGSDEMQQGVKVDTTRVIENTASTVDSETPVEQKRRKKVETEYVLGGKDLEFILSYEDDELETFDEDMLKDQAMVRQQIENFGYGFLHSWREVICTDSEEEDDPVSDDDDDDEQDDFFTNDDDDDQQNVDQMDKNMYAEA